MGDRPQNAACYGQDSFWGWVAGPALTSTIWGKSKLNSISLSGHPQERRCRWRLKTTSRRNATPPLKDCPSQPWSLAASEGAWNMWTSQGRARLKLWLHSIVPSLQIHFITQMPLALTLRLLIAYILNNSSKGHCIFSFVVLKSLWRSYRGL